MARKVSASLLAAIAIALTLPGIVSAQGTGAGTIAGVVRDDSGAVLPGVGVEVSSPVLIEKVRATVTDADGSYRVSELRPGSYAVVFTLPGFAVLRHEGIEITSNFTASINAVLKVSTLEETITVTGQTPLVDTSIGDAAEDHHPRNAVGGADVAERAGHRRADAGGGPAAERAGCRRQQGRAIGAHLGARLQDVRRAPAAGRHALQRADPGHQLRHRRPRGHGPRLLRQPAGRQEIVIDLGTMGSAEYGLGGAQINAIHKDGGNRSRGALFGAWTGHSCSPTT